MIPSKSMFVKASSYEQRGVHNNRRQGVQVCSGLYFVHKYRNKMAEHWHITVPHAKENCPKNMYKVVPDQDGL